MILIKAKCYEVTFNTTNGPNKTNISSLDKLDKSEYINVNYGKAYIITNNPAKIFIELSNVTEIKDVGFGYTFANEYLNQPLKESEAKESEVCDHEWVLIKGNPVVLNTDICIKCHTIKPHTT